MNRNDVKTRLTNLRQRLDTLFADAESLILLENVRLKEALTNQVRLQLYWENLHTDLCYLFNTCEEEVENAFSKAYKEEFSKTMLDITTTQAKEYAKSNTEYRNWARLLNEVRSTRDECKGILETIVSRKYILNNITNAKVSSVDNDLL